MEYAIFGEDVVDAADQNMKPDLQFQVDSGNTSSSDKNLVYLSLKNRGVPSK